MYMDTHARTEPNQLASLEVKSRRAKRNEAHDPEERKENERADFESIHITHTRARQALIPTAAGEWAGETATRT